MTVPGEELREEMNLKHTNTITLAELETTIYPQEQHVYKIINEIKLELEVFLPGNINDQQKPAIVFIHGGGWSKGKKEWFKVHAKYFAQRGMVTFSVN